MATAEADCSGAFNNLPEFVVTLHRNVKGIISKMQCTVHASQVDDARATAEAQLRGWQSVACIPLKKGKV